MSKNRLHNYLDKFPTIIEEIENRTGVDKQIILEILDHFMVCIKRWITDPRMPTIRITNFGTLKPSIGKITWNIKRSIGFYKKGFISKEILDNRIRKVWLVRKRLIQEKHGVRTWTEWRNKKIIFSKNLGYNELQDLRPSDERQKKKKRRNKRN